LREGRRNGIDVDHLIELLANTAAADLTTYYYHMIFRVNVIKLWFIIDKKKIIRHIDVHGINKRPRLEDLVKEQEKLEKYIRWLLVLACMYISRR
jgi:ferritin-like protein